MSTFPALLERRLRADPATPFVTFYDDATGERTELSVATYANWVAKSANLFVEELMLDPGDDLRIDLPTHWLGAVFRGAAWSCGLDLVDDAPVAVLGPEALARHDGPRAATTMACALHPFATRFVDPLPEGVLDHGALWAGQSDVFLPLDATELAAAAPSAGRVITDLNPLTETGSALLLDLVAGGGSLVLVAHPDPTQWPSRSQSERATATVRASG